MSNLPTAALAPPTPADQRGGAAAAAVLPSERAERRAAQDRTRERRRYERHVYVIGFSSGTVKVGQTKDPRQRLNEHAKNAAMHGVTVSRSWFSPAHTEYDVNEKHLITFCTERWPIAAGHESFTGSDFDAIVTFAKTLTFSPVSAERLATAAREQERLLRAFTLDRYEKECLADEAKMIEILGQILDLHPDDARWVWEKSPRGLDIFTAYVRAFGTATDKRRFVQDSADGLTDALVSLFVDAGREFTGPGPSITFLMQLEIAFAEVSR